MTRKAPWSKFEQVYTHVVERIEDGSDPMYQPGQNFPAASTLARYFDVSPSTVQQVVRALKKNGYLIPGAPGHRPRVRRHILKDTQ